MEQEEDKVELLATFGSPYCRRVELALKAKGVTYEYVDENIFDKSPLLLNYNPVFKTIPVLVHNGMPICESLFIIEYIDHVWPNGPKLMPPHPLGRAVVRFWDKFLQPQLLLDILTVIKSEGEKQAKALDEVTEKLRILEHEGMKQIFPETNGKPLVEPDKIGVLDLVMTSLLGHHKAMEQVLGLKIVDEDKTPLVYAWVDAVNHTPLVKDTLDHDKWVQMLELVRHKALTTFRDD